MSMLTLKSFDLTTFLPSQFRFISYSSPKLKISKSFPTLGKTKQQFKEECDINTIMNRYMTTGMIDHIKVDPPQYKDCADSLDFQSAMNFVIDAQNQFYALPAQLRARFGNDPGELLAFLDSPQNEQEAISLGLIPDPLAAAITVPLGTAKTPENGVPASSA